MSAKLPGAGNTVMLRGWGGCGGGEGEQCTLSMTLPCGKASVTTFISLLQYLGDNRQHIAASTCVNREGTGTGTGTGAVQEVRPGSLFLSGPTLHGTLDTAISLRSKSDRTTNSISCGLCSLPKEKKRAEAKGLKG